MKCSSLVLAAAALGVVFLNAAHADQSGSQKSGVAPVANVVYAKECGACHYAYPPGLMTAASWNKVLSNLSNHFGENAELPADTMKTVTDYATANAADKSTYRLSQKIARSTGNTAPTRISEIPYIAREHREIMGRYVKNNPKVGSLSKCQLCHTDADKGTFTERAINIPGHGAWGE